MGAARADPYVLRLQASRQKPNYKKGLNRKCSSGCHIDSKVTKKKKSAPMQIDTGAKYLRTCK
jgi:hypothetical protein